MSSSKDEMGGGPYPGTTSERPPATELVALELDPPSEPAFCATTPSDLPFARLLPFTGAREVEEDVACLTTAA